METWQNVSRDAARRALCDSLLTPPQSAFSWSPAFHQVVESAGCQRRDTRKGGRPHAWKEKCRGPTHLGFGSTPSSQRQTAFQSLHVYCRRLLFAQLSHPSPRHLLARPTRIGSPVPPAYDNASFATFDSSHCRRCSCHKVSRRAHQERLNGRDIVLLASRYTLLRWLLCIPPRTLLIFRVHISRGAPTRRNMALSALSTWLMFTCARARQLSLRWRVSRDAAAPSAHSSTPAWVQYSAVAHRQRCAPLYGCEPCS